MGDTAVVVALGTVVAVGATVVVTPWRRWPGRASAPAPLAGSAQLGGPLHGLEGLRCWSATPGRATTMAPPWRVISGSAYAEAVDPVADDLDGLVEGAVAAASVGSSTTETLPLQVEAQLGGVAHEQGQPEGDHGDDDDADQGDDEERRTSVAVRRVRRTSSDGSSFSGATVSPTSSVTASSPVPSSSAPSSSSSSSAAGVSGVIFLATAPWATFSSMPSATTAGSRPRRRRLYDERGLEARGQHNTESPTSTAPRSPGGHFAPVSTAGG